MSESSENTKSFGVTNIKVYIPLILDLHKLNYDAWKELFQTHSNSFGVKGHLTGTSKPVDANDVAGPILTISSRDNKQTRAIELDQELRTLTLGDLSISNYCERMKVISDLLTNIGSPVSEQTLVTYLINGLSPKFDNIATVLRHQDLLPSFLKCSSILTLEE
ncbi:uncharacterized protein LOC111901905 [Lactuca sativa]|uniref:uncharacterized protein LOC111901905 n=1 Tax=Lactuca sativa TaxID=4236 RepID=UPI000CD9F2DB|nr:uncharacterized protein LOC111901905 [Lactuca sativa]